MKKAAGLIFDDSSHYIDHLGPFCALRKWPLIVCEGKVADLARRYYPDLEVVEINRWELALPSFIVSCHPRGLIETAFSLDPVRTIHWLPHGNSDKGWKIPFFESLHRETVLVYGQRMIDSISKNNVFPQVIRIGNFRLQYWLKHLSFYKQILFKEIPLVRDRKTYLYAPTWDDWEENGTFWEGFSSLTAHLPDEYNLIVKIHPNTQRKFAPEIEQLIGRCAKRRNICILSEFPPVYPLLNIADVYIGDMSSIGYDFLYWKRPMYFLKETEPPPFLHCCGTFVSSSKIGSIFHREDPDFKEIQAKVYTDTFDNNSSY